MIRFLGTILLSGVLLAAVGCQKDEKKTEDPPKTGEPTSKPAKTE